jgi:hypothetical protein
LLLAVGESSASEPKSIVIALPDVSAYLTVGDCAVKAAIPPVMPKIVTEAVMVTPLLDCMWNRESSRGQNMFGDYRKGVPMATGHFQIWLSKHPITYDCAMDFDCSAKYTLEQIKAGKGYLWTSYRGCL